MQSHDRLLRDIEIEIEHLDIEDNEENALFDLIDDGIRHRWLSADQLGNRYRLLRQGEIEFADLVDWLEERQGDARYD